MIEVLSTGSGMTLQDAGRAGWGRFGVPQGGAMDARSMALANHLLGNRPDAPVLEIALQGARLQVVQTTWLALAGADHCSSLAAPAARRFEAGAVLTFDQKAPGRYAYLAVPGGFEAKTWFGSASTDHRNGMGQLLTKGARLGGLLKEPRVSTEGVACRRPSEAPEPLPEKRAHFAVFRGPQYEVFSREARQILVETEWTLSLRSDRTGYRLEGASLPVPESIPSEPVLPGSFQIPGGGAPIVTMPDGPTVGGYAKIAVLRAVDLCAFAQCPPQTKIQFSWIDSII
ncbi:MAG: hypothetical protein GVY36_15270 [Verrucomicrobia bacterium]|jgi:biotin-dependent carboxylase-like uncharacterized protein|nr:hypothetical protein [Verrucomicrobiota bacterium]